MGDTQFFIDLDSTIAGPLDWRAKGIVEQFVSLPGFPVQTRATTTQELFRLPEVLAAQKTPAWGQLIRTFRSSAQGVRYACPMLGAVAGVQRLAREGTITYCTVRKSLDPAENSALQQATQNWLRATGFPSPDQMLFCMSITHKLARIAAVLRETSARGVMIDDLYEEVFSAFQQFQRGIHPRFSPEECTQIATLLQQRLTFVAFGASNISSFSSDMHVIPLSCWGQDDDCVTRFL